MDQATQEQLVERFFELEDRGADGATGVETEWPVDLYLDPERYRREVAMMRRLPIPLAHVSQLAEPGDFVTETLFGTPIVLVHSHSGGYRGFVNVCRHRGAEVVRDTCGQGLKSFVCPYHAWTYDTDGRLQHVPDRERSFPNLDPEAKGLVELSVQERHGLLWVTLDGPAQPIDAFLGDELDRDLGATNLATSKVYKSEAFGQQFNWKAGTESFLENYHFAVLHRTTANRIFIHNLGLYDRLHLHFRAFAPKRNLAELRGVDREQWDLKGTATVMYVIFPFSCLFVEKDHFNLLQLFPEDAGRCRVKRTHVVKRLSRHLEEYWDGNIDLFMSAVYEDLDVCESMQRGYASGANRTVTFGRNEIGCDGYRRAIEEVLAVSEA